MITMRDNKGAIQLRVSKATAERLRTDNKYATDILKQKRAAEHNQVPHSNSPAYSFHHLHSGSDPACSYTHRCPTPETHTLSQSSSSDNLVPFPSFQPECHKSQTANE
ncbi:hypothetical protein GJAV_G00274270 [Gymnothorax javanicus]|nr:hypothetical protein GJAV_G00274270 [Gymnothorax javanicus]